MRRVVAAAVGLLAMLGARPSWGGGIEPVRLPDGSALPAVEFDRHVASLFGRLGCNAGSCHGSFQGRGGLNLSLFGADPARDFQAIARRASGRRVNVLDPDRSLVLLKATGQVPHEGGQRFAPGSWEYRVIRAWIADGARRDPARPAPRAIEIRPPESRLERPGATGRLAVVARFADGTEADVTAFCDLRVRDTEVADVSNTGVVRGLRPGDTAVVAAYDGLVAAARVLVPTGRTVLVPDVPASDLIDREVYAKLRALGIEPSGPAEDAEFLRRVTLDVIGTLPTPGEVRAFLADGSGDKRSKTIDRLLAHPMHAALWATRYLDITGCDVNAMEGPPELQARRARLWHDWFRARFAANIPYYRIARGVLCATTRDGRDARAWARREAEQTRKLRDGGETDYADRPGLDFFWRRLVNGEAFPVEPLAERVATTFLGIRIECAQCHKHPFDRWTQADYRSFANIVRRRSVRPLPRRPRRGRRPARRAAQVRSERRPAPDPSPPRGLSLAPVLPPRSPTPTPAARSPRGAGRARAARRRRPPRARSSPGWRRPTTPTSPAASSTASGRSTSARAWSIRSTASRSPTRPRTRGCSMPLRPTSSPTAMTSAGSSG